MYAAFLASDGIPWSNAFVLLNLCEASDFPKAVF
jgi:hypothetical protein